MSLVVYDSKAAPEPFGLNNTGAICYLNSLLQTLVGCTAFSRAVQDHAEYLRQTRTGAAMLEFVKAYTSSPLDPAAVAPLSARVLAALVLDLAARRPHFHFGAGQESASEALVFLLDMMEPPKEKKTPAEEKIASGDLKSADLKSGDVTSSEIESLESPVTQLFLHRYRCDVFCKNCVKIVASKVDTAVNFNLFHFDYLKEVPTTDASFSEALRHYASEVSDYDCALCDKRSTIIRTYTLDMVPEVLFCMFNLYERYGGQRIARHMPQRIWLPSSKSGWWLNYVPVGQVEHTGTLDGGHYVARGLRKSGQVHLFNDGSYSPMAFAPSPDTYIQVFHFEKEVNQAPPEDHKGARTVPTTVPTTVPSVTAVPAAAPTAAPTTVPTAAPTAAPSTAPFDVYTQTLPRVLTTAELIALSTKLATGI
jgi:ubiquitin C-terminal hydrolase